MSGYKRLLALLVSSLAFTGCWGDDDSGGLDASKVEQQLQETLADDCNRHDVSDVTCRAHDGYWSCSYASREDSGVITLDDDDSPQYVTVC